LPIHKWTPIARGAGTTMSAMFAALTTNRDIDVRRLDGALLVTGGALALATFVLWLEPSLSGRISAPFVDVAINAAATLVAGAVAILAWVRWRETGGVGALYESAAFVVLTLTNAVTLGLVLVGRGDLFGMTEGQPGAAAVYLWTVARLAAAALLVAGAVRGLRRTRHPSHPLLIAVGPAVGILVIAVALGTREAGQSIRLEGVIVVALQVLIFGFFMTAAFLFRRLYLRERLVSHAFLAVGLVVAGFSQLHFAMNPVVTIGIVTSGDVMRLAFNAVLFLGIHAELQSDLAALRRANAELRRLRDVDAASAGIAERSRLAREIHDGLAQDLWYAKLKQGRMVQAPELAIETRATGKEVLSAIDAALADARQAVMALRVDPTAAGSSLAEVLRTYTDDFADRFGIRAEFVAEGEVPRLSARTEAEVLRIVQEALNNVRRHADATLVRVHLDSTNAAVRATVNDNGKGFDAAARPPDRYGLRGMAERAELIGAELVIHSRPADGTRVVLDIPLPEAIG
jgi:signal transduction histidine kinase